MGSGSRWGLFPVLVITTMMAVAAEPDPSGDLIDQAGDHSRYLEAAVAAQRGDYVVAYCIWHRLAEQGDADAEYALGWMYHNGYGLVTDDLAAKTWWEKAIAQGHTDAMFSLGSLYSVGSETIDRNYSAALRLWLRAAAAGHENARFALRELLQRNLPELASMSRTLREQYPQLLGVPELRKGAKRRQGRNIAASRAKEDANAASQDPQSEFSYSGELIAVAAGSRPEYGWAAVQLFKEGKLLFSELPQ